jgi:hypothetical protein
MSETSHAEPVRGRIDARLDNPLERLRLLAGDDEAIASFLDELAVSSPREREMLAELARPAPLARPERFEATTGGWSKPSRASGDTASTALAPARRSGRFGTSSAGSCSSSRATSSSRT